MTVAHPDHPTVAVGETWRDFAVPFPIPLGDVAVMGWYPFGVCPGRSLSSLGVGLSLGRPGPGTHFAHATGGQRGHSPCRPRNMVRRGGGRLGFLQFPIPGPPLLGGLIGNPGVPGSVVGCFSLHRVAAGRGPEGASFSELKGYRSATHGGRASGGPDEP